MFSLAPHQIEAIAKLRNGNILVGGVGSGKSITALAYFTQKDPTRKIVVITTAKKRDSGEWFADAMKMSLRNELVVDSWNNIAKYAREYAFFIFDEQKVVGSGPWVNAFYDICRMNEWILLSATPADRWIDLVPVFVANGFYADKAEFNYQHVRFSRFVKYPKIDGYYDEHILSKLRESIYVEMPYLKTTERRDIEVPVDFNLEEQTKIYKWRWHIEEDRPIKDAGEMMRLLRKSTNSDPSRFAELLKICGKHPRVIVFYNHNYELEILRCIHTELDIPVAEWNGHNHQDIPDGDRWVYLVQYQAGSEGWNCITTDTVVFYSLPYSYRALEQAKGRVDRMNTPYDVLNYYILKSRSIIDLSIWKALLRKKSFQASAFAKKVWPKEQKAA